MDFPNNFDKGLFFEHSAAIAHLQRYIQAIFINSVRWSTVCPVDQLFRMTSVEFSIVKIALWAVRNFSENPIREIIIPSASSG